AGRALKMNFTTQQVRQLAADRQTEASAAVFSAGAGIRLLECLEDQLLLLLGNADAAIRHLEGDDGGRMAEDGMLGAPAAQGGRNAEPHAALRGELECVRQQIFQ